MKHRHRFHLIYKPHFEMCDNSLNSLLDDKKPDVILTKEHVLAEPENQVFARLSTLKNDGLYYGMANQEKLGLPAKELPLVE